METFNLKKRADPVSIQTMKSETRKLTYISKHAMNQAWPMLYNIASNLKLEHCKTVKAVNTTQMSNENDSGHKNCVSKLCII